MKSKVFLANVFRIPKSMYFSNLVFASDPDILCTGRIFDEKNEVSAKAFFDFSCALRIVYAVIVWKSMVRIITVNVKKNQ